MLHCVEPCAFGRGTATLRSAVSRSDVQVSVHQEFMFTRSMYGTADMQEQGELLTKVAELIDSGAIKTTVTEVLRPINAENLKKAHATLESGKAKGKIVLEGF
nr:zinc-binding dehydrogenase [Mycoplana azooxidifex]